MRLVRNRLTQVKYALAGQSNLADIVNSLAEIARLGKRLIDLVKYILNEARDAQLEASRAANAVHRMHTNTQTEPHRRNGGTLSYSSSYIHPPLSPRSPLHTCTYTLTYTHMNSHLHGRMDIPIPAALYTHGRHESMHASGVGAHTSRRRNQPA